MEAQHQIAIVKTSNTNSAKGTKTGEELDFSHEVT